MSDFNERDHPRDKDGKFVDKVGSNKSNDKYSDAKAKAKEVADNIKFSRLDHYGNPIKNKKKKDAKSKAVDVAETISIKTKLLNASKLLEPTKSVFTISQQDMPKNSEAAIKVLNKRLEGNGGHVERQGFGKVQINGRLSASYVTDKSEVVAILAIPDVIRRGLVISTVSNHKNRGYPSITFGAKVTIAGRDAHMAVSVKQTSKNFYSAHRVLLPNGESLEL